MGLPVHGYNSRVQIGGDVISGANAWDLTLGIGTVETTQFEDTHVRNVAGQKSDSGSITAWQYLDKKVLMDARGTEERLWIYPDTEETASYWYGVMLFTDYGGSSGTSAAVAATLAFLCGSDGSGMTAYGFTVGE